MTRQIRIVWFAAGLALAAPLHAQSPKAPASAPPAAQRPPAEQPPAEPKPAFSYDPAGRRDPFVSLLGRGGDPRSKASRPAGLGGILINEINLKGIMRDRTGFVAMVQGPDNKTYIVKPGDRLMDGTVKSILADAVVFSQDVNDPLSLVKQREIRKSLRSEESRG
jgi:type IV pilus assembly protein PilP